MAFAHIPRQPETIVYRDRDTIALLPDRLKKDPSAQIQVYSKDPNDNGVLLYEVAESDMPKANERILLFGRTLTNMTLTNGIKCVIYYDHTSTDESDPAKKTKAKVLREIIGPRATYDQSSNTIMMWFWTNYYPTYTESEYSDDPANLIWIEEWNFDVEALYRRALCCAVGSFLHVYIKGGKVGEEGEDSFDLVPVFQKPKIIQWRPQPADTTDAEDGVAIIDFTAGGGGGIGSIIQATEDGADGKIKVKSIQLKTDLAAHPNFKQIGDEFELSYYQL